MTYRSWFQIALNPDRENFSEKSAAGALTGGITVLRTAGAGTGGTFSPDCGPCNMPFFS
jgi:hypothetical protein